MEARMKLVALLTLVAVVVAACSPTAVPQASPQPPTQAPATQAPATQAPPTKAPDTPAPPTAEPTAAFEAPEGALVSVKAGEAPTLDGAGDEAVWAEAPELEILVEGGANTGSHTVTIKSVYTDDTVYFLVSYDDPTESMQRAPWQLQDDGTWVKLKDPDDTGGDNNLYYEDKLAMIWNINVAKFETLGCFVGCHTDDGSGKAFGNKYWKNAGEIADLWHWKSIRMVNQADDQYVDSTPYDKDNAPEAGRHSDPKDSGGYTDNYNEDKTLPAFARPGNEPAPPYFILDEEKVPFDPAAYEPGDEVPGIIVSEITGDRGDISVAWVYADGGYTLEISRALVTGSEFDVQFEDLSATYYFGVSVFDNAQVRHSYQDGSSPLVFKP
jgi:hypothetical protein